MTPVSVTGPDEGERIELGPATIRILEDGANTAHRLGMAEIHLAPGTAGPPQHRHARHDEGFYVVSGTAVFTVGETDHVAPPGTLVMINTFTPDLYVQYFKDLRTMIEASGPLTPEATIEVMSHYATEPATDYA